MTTVFTPTIDIDLRPQPLVPTDPRKLEQVDMGMMRMRIPQLHTCAEEGAKETGKCHNDDLMRMRMMVAGSNLSHKGT